MINIQKADRDDLPEILILQKLAYQENALRYDDFAIPPLRETLDELVLAMEEKVFLKAVVDDTVVGSVRACPEDGYVYVEKLIVHPDYQNQGIGRKLMLAIEQEFDTSVFRLVTGHLDEKNLSLYAKLGYVVYGEPEQITPTLAFVHMEKSGDEQRAG